MEAKNQVSRKKKLLEKFILKFYNAVVCPKLVYCRIQITLAFFLFLNTE